MQTALYRPKQAPNAAHSIAARQTRCNSLFDSVSLLGVAMPFAKGEEICGENEDADHVYKVLSGAVRTYKILNDGRRQIGSFYLPGDVFGMEAGGCHSFSAEAVVDSNVLMVRRSALLAASQRDSGVMNNLLACTSLELERARNHALLLVKTAQERVASFLLEMAGRLPGEAVELPMCRQDIADYLGLTIETVSRTLTQLGNAHAIELPTSRRIILRNRSALAELNT